MQEGIEAGVRAPDEIFPTLPDPVLKYSTVNVLIDKTQ